MDPPVHHCANHPAVPAIRPCDRCRARFCEQCLVELRASRLCEGCKQAVVAELERPFRADLQKVVFWARAYDGMVVAFAFLVVPLALIQIALRVVETDTGWTMFYPDAWFWTSKIVPALLGLVLALPPLVGLASARRWAYQWQLWMLLPSALLTTVSGSCFGFLTWPGAVILMIYWTKPAIKAYHEGC